MPLDLQTMLWDGKSAICISKDVSHRRLLRRLKEEPTAYKSLRASWISLMANAPSFFKPVMPSVLNSLALLPRIREQIVGYKEVESFLDNDDAGCKSFAVLRQMFLQVVDGSARYREHKDLNEWLVAQSKIKEKQVLLPTTKTWHQKIACIWEASLCLSISKPTCSHLWEVKIPLVSSKK